MATTPDIQNSERLLDLSNQLNDSINERKKLLKGLNAEEQQYFATVKQQQRLSQDIAANAEKYLGYQIKSKDLAKQIKATKDNQAKTETSFIKNINNQASLAVKLENQRQEALKRAYDIRKQIKQQTESVNKLDEKNQELQILKNEAERNGNVNLAKQIQTQIRENQRVANNKEKYVKTLETQFDKEKNIAKTAREIVENGKKLVEDQKKEIAFLEKNLEIRKRIEKSTGLLGAISKSIAKIPGIGQYVNADEAIDEMEKLAASIEEAGGKSTSFGNRLKIGLKGATTLAKGFYENIKSPEAVFTFIVTQATKANKQAVELGKALGYSVDKANALRENFALMAGFSSNINVNSQSLTEAFSQLAQTTGFVYEFSADQLETQVKLTKQVGLQADEAAQIQRFAVLNGKTSEETYRSFVRGLTAARNQLKVGINFKAALAEASKVSGQLAANLGNNPETIAKAVVTAKAFGMTLEQVAAAGDKLLDFGSSLENELKAELLLGKQLNLERARAAALAGDQVTLAEELSKNVGTAAEFTKLNRLQQNALAESVGMTSDALAETLRKREEALASGKSLAQVTEEEAAQALERQAIQEKFSAALLKIQDVVGSLVAGPFGQLFDLIANIASLLTTVISPIITSISYVVGLIVDGFKTLSPILIGIGGLLGVMYARSIAIAVAKVAQNAWSAFSGVPFAGPILATAATLAGVGLIKRLAKADDLMSEGYGKRTLTTPEGTFALNNRDTIVAGTDLGVGEGEGKAAAMPSIDLTPMIAAINEVRAAVDRLYSKDTSINMDSKKVGSTLVQGSYKAA